jgi:hypothetical protein
LAEAKTLGVVSLTPKQCFGLFCLGKYGLGVLKKSCISGLGDLNPHQSGDVTRATFCFFLFSTN